MLNRIIKLSLNNRLVVILGAIIIMAVGIISTINIEVDTFPDLNAPTVVVMTEATGMTPEEVERVVTFPIETTVNGATDVRRVRSSSTTGFSVVWVEFDWGTDIFRARQIVSERLATLEGTLPDGIGKPTMGPQSSILGEILIISMTSDKTSMADLRTIADWQMRTRLLSLGGVSQVTVLGGDIKEYQVLLNPEKMNHYGVTISEVMAATANMNMNATGGVLNQYGNEYIIQGVLSTNNIESLSATLIKMNGNSPIMLSDIAKVQTGPKLPVIGTASEKGVPAVMLTVVKQPNVSTLELTEKIEGAVEEMRKELPSDISISTDLFRQSTFINNSIDNIKSALFEGAIFVVIVLMIFLMNFRTTLITVLAIPLSLLTTLIVMKVFGLTINTMSLGGMAIAIGSLVDDAIVDVENVFKRLGQNSLKPKEERQNVLSVVFEASKEVRTPILNSTLIIVAAFLPLFFLDGMEGRMLIPLGIAFIVSLFASTIVALTFTPVLSSYLFSNALGNKGLKESAVSTWLKKGYLSMLNWALVHKTLIISSTAVVLVASIILFTTFGRSFLPPFNEGAINIGVSTMPGTSLEESSKMGAIVEKIVMEIPEVNTIGRKTGRAELDEHSAGVNASEIEVPFTLKDRTMEELFADVRSRLGELQGVNITIDQPISHRINAMLSGSKSSIAIKIFGDNLNTLFQVGNSIKENIESIEGIADLNVEQQIERSELRIIPRRNMLARYGITLAEFSEFIKVALSGEVVSSVYEKDRLFDLTVKMDDDYRASMDNIKDLLITASDGKKIPLSYVADVESSVGPNTIGRENVKRKVVVSANSSGRDIKGIVDDIIQTVNEKVEMPEGYFVEYGGQFESEKAASKTLMLVSIASIFIIFLILFTQFRSVKVSGLIMLNLPLAIIGGVVSIWVTSGNLSIPAIIGFISLFGIATRNGILLFDHYEALEKEGNSLKDAIVNGSMDRLNPILMTALTSALALIPLAVYGNLPGNEIQSPMAVVILGGLISSTILNIFIMPIFYYLLRKRQIEKGGVTKDDNLQ